jgi:Spy/CpxP family protein refolding chaperone
VINMSKKTLTWLLIFSMVINISAIVTFSYYRWFKTKKLASVTHRSTSRGFLSQKLGLTEEQSNKVRDLRSNLWKEIKPLKIQLNEARRDLIEILKKDTIEVEGVNLKIDQISQIQKEIQQKTIENLMEHKSILTPEQRKKFIAIVTRRMYMRHSKRGHPEFKKERFKPENKLYE